MDPPSDIQDRIRRVYTDITLLQNLIPILLIVVKAVVEMFDEIS